MKSRQKPKKWTHLQKFEESVGKFQSLLSKCKAKKPEKNEGLLDKFELC